MMQQLALVVFAFGVVRGAIPRNIQNHQMAALAAVSTQHLGHQEALKVIVQEKLDAFHMKLVKSVYTDVGEWVQYFENFITAKILDHEIGMQNQVADLGSMFENTLKLFGKTVSKYDATLALLQESSEKIWKYQERYETRCARKSTTDRTPRHRHRHQSAEVVPEVVAAEAPVAISASGAEFVEVFGGDYDEAPEAFNNATESIYVPTTTTRSTMSEEVKAEIRQWLKPIFVQG
jgi:hypothetical protein